MSAAAAQLLAAFDRQVAWCRQPAPFSARVLERTRLWLERDAQALAALAAIDPDPLAAAVSLRWLAALHHLALRGLQPWAGLWPPAAGPTSDETLDAAIAAAWQQQNQHLRKALSGPPQTNEVQRSAALLPGLLHVVAQTGLPLVLLEIGASAGLNLWCDHYRHEHGAWAWGDPAAALILRSEWVGALPPQAPLRILRRAGCDAQPIDLNQAGEGLRLASFIWADQRERLERLRAAQRIAAACMAQSGVAVQPMPAAHFLRQELRHRQPGQATVLMHSVVWQYIVGDEQADIAAQMATEGASTTASSPLAWLRLEPAAPDQPPQLRCRIWPGGQDVLLADCHPHGAHIRWLAGVAA